MAPGADAGKAVLVITHSLAEVFDKAGVLGQLRRHQAHILRDEHHVFACHQWIPVTADGHATHCRLPGNQARYDQHQF